MNRIAEEIQSCEYFIKGSFKLIHYSMAKFDMNLLRRVLEKVEGLIGETNDEVLIAKINKFKGYYLIQTGRYDEGEKYLMEGIKTLESTYSNKKYILGIAASYVYLGESYYYKKKYSQAIGYYDKALNLCKEENILSGVAYILSGKGKIYYDLNDKNKAENVLNEAINIYDESDNIWGAYIPYYYLARIYADRGEQQKATEYVDRVFDFIKNYSDEFEKNIHTKIENEIGIKFNKLCS
jgi:tetratricopeptide (TPR) repeat protein